MVLVDEFAVMAHAEFVHLVLNISEASQTCSFLHHLDHVFVFQFEGYVAPVLH